MLCSEAVPSYFGRSFSLPNQCATTSHRKTNPARLLNIFLKYFLLDLGTPLFISYTYMTACSIERKWVIFVKKEGALKTNNLSRGLVISIIFLIIFFSMCLPAVADNRIPTGQTIGAAERVTEEAKEKEAAAQKLLKEPEKGKIEGKEAVVPPKEISGKEAPPQKTFIKTITVKGNTVLDQKVIDGITSPYENKELTLEDFNTISGEITDQYRKKGYVTSQAYLPPQRITDNTLVIEVAEGKVGNVNLQGNKYFLSKNIIKLIGIKKGELFNYDVLRTHINYINEHPDRNASVVLARGAEKSETDVNVNLKDRNPVHATLAYNNYNSKYLGEDKLQGELKLTNLWGMDHIASAEFQMGEANMFRLFSGKYLMPLNEKLNVNASYIQVDQSLGGTVKDLKIKGRGNVASVLFSYKLVNTDDLTMRVNPGFVYKNIQNELLDVVISEDNTRTAQLGFDIDLSDRFGGRNIITQEFDAGIPNLMGGLHSKDPRASRSGTGGRFFKSVTNAARVQSMPASTTLMLKGAMQLSAESLVAAEQFNIGGYTTVRGYPVSEYTGDNGYTLTGELYIPPYFLSKDVKVPLTNKSVSFFDALRGLCFIDWGYVTTRSPKVGEVEDRDIAGVGAGIRFDVQESLSFSFDYGHAVGKQPSDGDRNRFYWGLKLFY